MSIHDSFLGLLDLSPALNVYDGKVPDLPALPYVLVSGFVPRVTERGVSRIPQGSIAKYRTTVTGSSEASVRIIAGRVTDALEHTKLTVPGYSLGRVESRRDDLPILEDHDVTINSMHPFYVVMEWVFTVSRT